MQKIYVLLRHDKQTGPYSLEEIIQFNLKPYDLIWIEGKSAGWYYPQEIAALHPFLSFLPKAPKPEVVSGTENKTAFVPIPSATNANLPQPAPQPEPQPGPPTFTPKPVAFSKPVTDNIEEKVYAQFRKAPDQIEPAFAAAPPKEGSKKSSRTGAVALATILVVGGVFAASWVMNRQPEEVVAPASNYVEEPLQTDSINSNPGNTKSGQSIHSTFAGKPKQTKKAQGQRQITFSQQNNADSRNEKTVNADAAGGVTDYPITTSSPEEDEPVRSKEEAGTTSGETSAPQEKKKTLGDKFLDLFRKKPEEGKDEAKGTETQNGERKVTRREGAADLTQMVHVRFDVPNNWMMGIRAAKATLVNRSSQTIAKAVVEVQYYDDDNNLLEKKTVTFSKIDGKESRTITIPDHASATKVDYSIVSVTGEPSA